MHEHETASPVGKNRVADPVCGMQVDADAPLHSHYHGTDYRFCSQRCSDAFEADPLSREVFGPRMFDAFVQFKRAEWRSYHNHVSDWEIRRYLKMF